MKAGRSSWMLTGGIALLTGVLLGIWLVPTWRASARLHALASDDVKTRSEAWTWWNSTDVEGQARATMQVDAINEVLLDAPDDALLHAADQLHRLDRWGWSNQPPALIARHLGLLRWRAHVLDLEDAVALIEAAPLDAASRHVVDPTLPLLAHPDPAVAAEVFAALAAWAGMESRLEPVLDALPPERAHWSEPYRAWLTAGPRPILIETITPYRSTDDSTAIHHQLVLQAISLEELDRRDTSLGRIAARLDDPDPHRRQVSALLAALRGQDGKAVAEAMLIERDAQARLTMRLALDAMGRPVSDDDPGEFAWRAIRGDDEQLWHVPVLTRLLSGDPALLQPLLVASMEDRPLDRAVTWALARRFMPDWIADQPTGGLETIPIEAFFPRLLARWHLERRRLGMTESGVYRLGGL